MASGKERRIDQINSRPGYGRDGTVLDSPSFIDGQWTRFQKGRPKKIGGYKEIASNIDSICRGAYVYSKSSLEYLYGFSANKMWISTTTQFGASSIAVASTFGSYSVDDIYSFQCDTIFDASGSGTTKLIVHGASNLSDVANTNNTKVYMCDVATSGATLTALTDGAGNDIEVSGGVVVLQPYVFVYGNDGLIRNSRANSPNDWQISVDSDANEVNISGTKIVKGLPLRAGANSPSGLFWALDSLIKVSKAGTEFRYDTLSSQTTIISPHSVVEYDGVYYWIGVDRFLMYNGTVNEIPNVQNLNWFFDNVNYVQRSKIWAIKNTRYGEIWWFFPFGNAVECTHAIIYNVRENCWYDTAHSRSCGYSARVFRYPIMFDNSLNSKNKYSNYIEEYGKNAILNGNELAIPTWFETADFGYPTGGAAGEQPSGNDFWTRLERIEPDFIQKGEMSVTVKGREFANGSQTESDPYRFSATTEKIDMREQRRQICLRFDSNVVGGDFHMGRVILHTETGDIRS